MDVRKKGIWEDYRADILFLSNKNPSIKIISPLSKEDKEWRYGIFRFNPGKQEIIENGVKSWSGK